MNFADKFTNRLKYMSAFTNNVH